VRSAAKAEVVVEAAAEAGVSVETTLLDVTDPADFVPGSGRRLSVRSRSVQVHATTGVVRLIMSL
jgi:hypothetical protein